MTEFKSLSSAGQSKSKNGMKDRIYNRAMINMSSTYFIGKQFLNPFATTVESSRINTYSTLTMNMKPNEIMIHRDVREATC